MRSLRVRMARAVALLAVALMLTGPVAAQTGADKPTADPPGAKRSSARTPPATTTPAKAPPGKRLPAWVTIGDAAFAKRFAAEAISPDQDDRSRFAWRLFARLNQQVALPSGQDRVKFSAWETWASNTTTFPVPLGAPTSRSGPDQGASVKRQIGAARGEERTRNQIAYDYIVSRGLYLAPTAKSILATPAANRSPRVDFPLGSIETKAVWLTGEDWAQLTGEKGLPNDMYAIRDEQGTLWGLAGLHVMVKIATYPDGPRQIDDPSWFWTTFEYYRNPNRKFLIGFVTYPDSLDYAAQRELLAAAGLDGTPFAKPVQVPVFDPATGKTTTVLGNSYLSNGSQFRFVGPEPASGATVNVILGNSVLELEFTYPSPPGAKNPFRAWNSSCHTCHYEAAGNRNTLLQTFHAATGRVMLGNGPEGQKLFPVDFEWSIPLLAGLGVPAASGAPE